MLGAAGYHDVISHTGEKAQEEAANIELLARLPSMSVRARQASYVYGANITTGTMLT